MCCICDILYLRCVLCFVVCGHSSTTELVSQGGMGTDTGCAGCMMDWWKDHFDVKNNHIPGTTYVIIIFFYILRANLSGFSPASNVLDANDMAITDKLHHNIA